MKRIGILYHPLKETANTLAKKLEEFLEATGHAVWTYSAWEWERAKAQVDGTDLIISVGGDGTILRAAQITVGQPIPIIGINLGKLGFMTELSQTEVMVKLPTLLAGRGWIDERFLLQAELSPSDQATEPSQTFYALNDVVVARGDVARLIYIETLIDGEPLTTYKADGVIMATATGSTGYALAAGGPILHPQAKEYLLLPLLPHLSPSHPLVLPLTSIVKLHLDTTHSATLSIDGHINLSLATGAAVTVKHSTNTVKFFRTYPQTSFYGFLEQKLKGKVS